MQTNARINTAYFNQNTIDIKVGETQYIKVKKGNSYNVVVQDDDKNFIARKTYSDLEILLPNKTAIVFDNYFDICFNSLSCIVTLPLDNSIYYVADNSFITLADGSEIIYFYGDTEIISNIAANQSEIFAENFIEFYFANNFSKPYVIAGALSAGAITTLLASSATTATTISGFILLGPILENSGLKVELYQVDGKSYSYITTANVNDDGSFLVNLADYKLNDYKGVIIAKIIDTDKTNYDYQDEATGREFKLSTSLFTIIKIDAGNNIININPITAIAAYLAGLSNNNDKIIIADELTEDKVKKTNIDISSAFGLENIITNNPHPMIDKDGNTNIKINSKEAIFYGELLAAFSGVGDLKKAIINFADNIDKFNNTIKLNNQAQENLASGGAVTEFTNPNISAGLTKNIINSNIINDAVKKIMNDKIILSFKDSGLIIPDNLTNNNIIVVIDAISLHKESEWVYSVNDGRHWIPGAGNSFKLDDGTYNKADILVRKGNNTAANKDNSYSLSQSGTIIIDTKVDPLIIDINNNIVTIDNLENGASWEYTTNDKQWQNGIGNSFMLIPDGAYLANSIKVRQTDKAGNISAITSYDKDIGSIKLLINQDTGIKDNDNITNHNKINVINLVTNIDWQYSINNGVSWIAGTGTDFVLNDKTYTANSIQVKQIKANNVEVIAKIPTEITIDTAQPQIISSAVAHYLITSKPTTIYDTKTTINNDESGINYSLDSASLDKFTINAYNGKVNYIKEPTNKNLDIITITATDIAGNSSNKEVSIYSVPLFIASFTTTTANQLVISPFLGENYKIDWNNDGKFDNDEISNNNYAKHRFADIGEHEVRVYGLTGINCNNKNIITTDLSNIKQWGATKWQELIFSGKSNIVVTATDTPDLSLFNDKSIFLLNTSATNFNINNINNWNVAKITNMQELFYKSLYFNQDISKWDISSLKNANNMLSQSGLSTKNYDKLLSSWSVIDKSSGETNINLNVELGATKIKYTDATARQHLINHYNWNITDEGVKAGVSVGSDNADELLITTQTIIHGLGGNDIIVANNANHYEIHGGEGNDTITGGNVTNTFHYSYIYAGNDTITNFNMQNDKLDLSDLIDANTLADGFDITKFISITNDNQNTTLIIDSDGAGIIETTVSITLMGINAINNVTFLNQMVTNGNLILE